MQTYGRAICLMKNLLELFSSVVCEIAFSMKSDLQKNRNLYSDQIYHPSIHPFFSCFLLFLNNQYKSGSFFGRISFSCLFSMFVRVFPCFPCFLFSVVPCFSVFFRVKPKKNSLGLRPLLNKKEKEGKNTKAIPTPEVAPPEGATCSAGLPAGLP